MSPLSEGMTKPLATALNEIANESVAKQVLYALHAFSQTIEELRSEIRRLKDNPSQRLWPEVMTFETAGLYMDRTSESVRHLVRKRVLPRVEFDTKPQLRKYDIDRAAEKSLI